MRKYDGYLKSGEVAQIIGVAKSTIKNWDDQKILIADERTDSNIRLYKPETVDRFLRERLLYGGN